MNSGTGISASCIRIATAADIADCFRGTVAQFPDPETTPPRTPVAAIVELEGRNTADGSVPPLIEFAERIALRLAEPHRGQLRQWTDRVTARLDVQSSLVLLLRSRLSPATQVTPSPAYFVTRLEPDAIDPSRYLLTIWLQHGTSPGIPVRREETPRPVEEIRQLVGESFSRARAYAVEEVGLLTLEFVLPITLLGLAVDQWQIGSAAFPHPIGVDRPVVLRSLDRRRSPSFQDHWRRNDEWLRHNGTASCEPALMWATREGAGRMHARLVRQGPPIGVVFSFSPAQPRQAHDDHLTIAIEAGAVALLWSRTVREPPVEHDLRDFLSGYRISELPEAVWQYRAEAADSASLEEHLGSSLTLFWDRYDRYPEDPRTYRAPGWEGLP
jgi:hypothetical protein